MSARPVRRFSETVNQPRSRRGFRHNLWAFAVLAASLGAAGAAGCKGREAVTLQPSVPDAGVAAGREEMPAGGYFGQAPDGKLHAYFFDVEGEAALIVSPAGRTVLRVRTDTKSATHLVHRVAELLTGPVDLLVVTGRSEPLTPAVAEALRRVGARNFLGAGTSDVTAATLGREGMAPFVPAADPRQPFEAPAFSLGPRCNMQVLWPPTGTQSPDAGTSDSDPVLRVVFERTSILLAGAASPAALKRLLERSADLRTSILQASVGAPRGELWGTFSNAVAPLAAVASGGVPSSSSAVMQLEERDIRVFRTDLDGELHVEMDGRGFSVKPTRPAAGEPFGKVHVFPAPGANAEVARVQGTPGAKIRFAASRHSPLFHRPECRAVKQIHSRNLVVFTTREEAERERKPASDCKP